MTSQDLISAAMEKAWDKISDAQPDSLACWPAHRATALRQVMGYSDFITAAIARDATLLPWLDAHLDDPSRYDGYRDELAALLSTVQDEIGLHRVLRQFRRREMVWIAWHDFTGQAALTASLAHLSHLAEA